ncbi:MAG: hypothetical protein A4E33_01630 [Methanoregula sp. PtaB.Bin085]|nr:MAG: hypothetical protein A4E33_01630 [Methanoregula sp. PtaB.Bin085]
MGFPVAVAGDLLVAEEDPGKDPPVLLGRVVDPAGEHPVEDLVVARTLDLCHPPDAPFRDRAHEPLPVPADGAVDERLPEGGSHAFEDLLHLVGERGIVEHDHAAGLQVVVVEERFVAHRPLEPESLRDLPEHRSERVALALPALAGDGDVQSVGVDYRSRGEGEDEAFGDSGVALMVECEGPEHLAQRVAGIEDLKGLFHFRGRSQWRSDGPGVSGRGRRAWRRIPLIPVPEFLPPLRTAAAALVVAAGKHRPARELDGERPVVVCGRERALLQGIQGPAVPGTFRPDADAVPGEPGTEVEGAVLLCVRCQPFGGNRPCELLQECRRYDLQNARSREHPGHPVRAVPGVVPLSRCRAVELPDPGGVEIRRVDAAYRVREEQVQHFEAPLHQVPACVIVREIDPVEKMRTVARVREDWGRPSLLVAKKPGDHFCPDKGCPVLAIGRRDAARPLRVHVDGKPPAADDVGIACRGVLPAEPELHPVCPPCEECGIHFVQGDIDPLDIWERVERLGLCDEGFLVVEVPAVDCGIRDCPEFDHVACRREEGECVPEIIAHGPAPASPGMSGKSGADCASPRATRRKFTIGVMKWPALL